MEHDSSNGGKWTGGVAHLPQYGRGQHNALIPNVLVLILVLVPILIPIQVDTLCDRLAILVAGRVNAEGSPDQLKQQFGGGYKVSFKLGVKFMLKLIAQFSCSPR